MTRSFVLSCLALSVACGGPATGAEEPPRAPTACVAEPEAPTARRAAIDELGRRAWSAMRAGRPQALLVDDLALRALVEPAAATRIAAQRLDVDRRVGPTEDFGPMLDEAEYAGVCLQGARGEPAGGVLGLREDGWIFDRLLVIGRRPNGRRVAAWIEGGFLYTDAGFFALDLERVERPRWEHSDLEIAPCDLSIRDDLPEPAR